MNTELLQLLTQGYTLITPTNRLARHLQYQFAAMQINAGKQAWETPDIISWNAWLQRTWGDLAILKNLDQVLLSAPQQQLVWREIISKSAYAGRLLQSDNTAKQAILTWQLCKQWEIPDFPDSVYINEDAFAFQQWSRSYQQRCRDNHWIDDATIPEQLINNETLFYKNKKFALTGFDDFTPQQKSFISKLKKSGCTVKEQLLQKRNRKVIAQGFTDTREEIRAAAIWARQRLEYNQQGSIGIIVHNLQTLHIQIQNVFDDIFQPGDILVNAEPSTRPYSISLGLPLHRYPLIDAAFNILKLGHPYWVIEEYGSLLRTPFIRDAKDESQQRARFDASLRKHAEYRITFTGLQRLIKDEIIKSVDVPWQFIQACMEFHSQCPTTDKKQSGSAWARTFTSLLAIFRWPGERILTSAEYQTVTEWQDLLNQLAMLDLVTRRMNYREALSQLRQLAMNTRFQPETAEVPVQVMGFTGAAGMQFDHLWIAGLHEEAWPPKTGPDPFVPLKLQRTLKLPDATAENKLVQITKLTEQLVHSAGEVILSYPLHEKDRPLRPSPLIKLYLSTPDSGPEYRADNYAQQLYRAGQLEQVEDLHAPAIFTGEPVSGGTGLFKDQAACPFRAFARHRLYAEGLESKDIGLNAMDRGSIMHTVMEKIWRELKTQQALLDKSAAELQSCIEDAVTGTLHEYQQRFPFTFTGRFTQLEKNRLQAVVKEVLQIERERQPFVVTACEHWHVFTFNDISIRTRIDRIDQLVDGRYVVMDYKTGNTKIKNWFGERPDDPQLPLYVITTEGEVAAIVFVKLKRGEVSYSGLSETGAILPGVNTVENTRDVKNLSPDWSSLINQWQQHLTTLAIQFREGYAVVDPKDGNSCNYCDLHALCRIYAQQQSADEISVLEDQYE